MSKRPFSDSTVSFQSRSGRKIGPIRIAVFEPEQNPEIMDVVKGLGILGERGSEPPYEPGYR